MATENYFEKSIVFKIRKVLRYIKLYGIHRTYEKIRGQFHMRSSKGFDEKQWINKDCKSTLAKTKNIGILGCGSFAFSTIAYYLEKEDKVFLKGAMDLDSRRARSLVSRYDGAYATTEADLILNDPDINLVFIASNHATHADYAVQAIRLGKHVHIEKPHVVSETQLIALRNAMHENPHVHVFLGFNRPKSQHFKRLKIELDKENGPLMINCFVAGHPIDDDHWYFKASEGGRTLGNLCHWSDLSLEMIPLQDRFPCTITPSSPQNSKSDFVTAIQFADGSLACITFSAKGHTFEGIRETLNVHKGNLLAEIKDFKSISITREARHQLFSSTHRDHGHQANIINSIRTVRSGEARSSISHIINTARLFLAIRDAHENRATIVLPSL